MYLDGLFVFAEHHARREDAGWDLLLIATAFIIVLLLTLVLFPGQPLSDTMSAVSRTLSCQQGVFLNAIASIEFFKANLRMMPCPRYPSLRFFLMTMFVHATGAPV